jgi:hypothetical protein
VLSSTVHARSSSTRLRMQCRCVWTYSHHVSAPDDPDYDAWLAASLTSQEELELPREPAQGETLLVGDAPRSWRRRLVEDTRPLEAYEP